MPKLVIDQDPGGIIEVADYIDRDGELLFLFKTDDMVEPKNFYMLRRNAELLYEHLEEVLKLRF